MKIGISAESLAVKACGMQTYIMNLLEGVANAKTDHTFVAFLSTKKALDLLEWNKQLQPRLVRPYSSWVRVPVSLPLELYTHPVDLLHVQNVAPPICPCPFVATIHDLSYELLPDTFTPLMRFRLSLLIPRTARRAMRIITSSYNSLNDLVRLYRIDPEKITVIYPGLRSEFRPILDADRLDAVRAKYTRGEPYILYLGVLEPKKNVHKLIRAYAKLRRERDFAFKLAIAGPPAWLHTPIYQLVRELGLEDQVLFLGRVPDEDQAALYSAAKLFCFLSAYEGFGFPPAEAMACGTPAVVSRGGSLPEVTGDAGLVVDPDNIDDIARAIAHIVDNDELREHLRERGLIQAAQFTTTGHASRVLGVYDELAEQLLRHNLASASPRSMV